MVHQFDPDPAPDDAFESGAFEFLVPGNRARMTYVETAAMKRPFREAEAVLVVSDEYQPFPV